MDDFLYLNSVETVPNFQGRVVFHVDSAEVFREDTDTAAQIIDDNLSYVRWGEDNNLPFDILNLIEKDYSSQVREQPCQVLWGHIVSHNGSPYPCGRGENHFPQVSGVTPKGGVDRA